jgi:hypothetical protein
MPQDFPQFGDGDELQPWHLNLFSKALAALFGIRLGPGLGGRFSFSGCALWLEGHRDHGRIAMTGGSGIPGRVGTTAGVGTVTLYKLKYDGSIVTTARTERVYNLSATSVGGDAWIMLKRLENGRLVCDWEECPS